MPSLQEPPRKRPRFPLCSPGPTQNTVRDMVKDFDHSQLTNIINIALNGGDVVRCIRYTHARLPKNSKQAEETNGEPVVENPNKRARAHYSLRERVNNEKLYLPVYRRSISLDGFQDADEEEDNAEEDEDSVLQSIEELPMATPRKPLNPLPAKPLLLFHKKAPTIRTKNKGSVPRKDKVSFGRLTRVIRNSSPQLPTTNHTNGKLHILSPPTTSPSRCRTTSKLTPRASTINDSYDEEEEGEDVEEEREESSGEEYVEGEEVDEEENYNHKALPQTTHKITCNCTTHCFPTTCACYKSGHGCNPDCYCTACVNMLNKLPELFGLDGISASPDFMKWIRRQRRSAGAFDLLSDGVRNELCELLGVKIDEEDIGMDELQEILIQGLGVDERGPEKEYFCCCKPLGEWRDSEEWKFCTICDECRDVNEWHCGVCKRKEVGDVCGWCGEEKKS